MQYHLLEFSMIESLFPLSRSFLSSYNKPYKRYLLSRSPFKHPFVILLGSRGVGKTTLIIQHIHATYQDALISNRVLYLPADHFLVGESSLYAIAEEFRNLGGELLCIDEIHKYPNWSKELKSINDSFPELSLIASGSAALVISKGSHDLSRRALVVTMSGMSFREYVEQVLDVSFPAYSLEAIIEKHAEIAESVIGIVEKQEGRILSLFQRYLMAGYYPFGLQIKDVGIFHLLVEQSMHAAIETDLLAIHSALNGGSIKRIKKLLSVLASSVPFVIDLRKLKIALEIGDERTLKTYLEYLAEAGVLALLPKAGGKIRSLAKPEKVYCNNTNQAYSLLGNPATANIGTIRETFLVSMVASVHEISIPLQGDFLIDNTITLEVGGKTKDFKQLRGIEQSYLAVDEIERGAGRRIPLWLFGFLY